MWSIQAEIQCGRCKFGQTTGSSHMPRDQLDPRAIAVLLWNYILIVVPAGDGRDGRWDVNRYKPVIHPFRLLVQHLQRRQFIVIPVIVIALLGQRALRRRERALCRTRMHRTQIAKVQRRPGGIHS